MAAQVMSLLHMVLKARWNRQVFSLDFNNDRVKSFRILFQEVNSRHHTITDPKERWTGAEQNKDWDWFKLNSAL